MTMAGESISSSIILLPYSCSDLSSRLRNQIFFVCSYICLPDLECYITDSYIGILGQNLYVSRYELFIKRLCNLLFFRKHFRKHKNRLPVAGFRKLCIYSATGWPPGPCSFAPPDSSGFARNLILRFDYEFNASLSLFLLFYHLPKRCLVGLATVQT
jgi:hypothetical protein